MKVVVTNNTVFKRRMLTIIALLAIAIGQISLASHAGEHSTGEHPYACAECLAFSKDQFDCDLDGGDDPEQGVNATVQLFKTDAVSAYIPSFVTAEFPSSQHDFRRSRAPPISLIQ